MEILFGIGVGWLYGVVLVCFLIRVWFFKVIVLLGLSCGYRVIIVSGEGGGRGFYRVRRFWEVKV